MDMQILPTNAIEPMRIAPCEYHRHVFVEIRVSFQDDAGACKPTKKGVTVSVDPRMMARTASYECRCRSPGDAHGALGRWHPDDLARRSWCVGSST
jgi:Transcriptional Coactivator p15 (PC4)